MRYVALLRGINVGGNNKIDMKTLVSQMEAAGFEEVSTYINSGNVFLTSNQSAEEVTDGLKKLISSKFDLDIPVLVKNKSSIECIVNKISDSWKNDSNMKCDVMFLWQKYDNKSVLNELTIQPVDTVLYEQGAIIWKVDRKDQSKSGMNKLVGTDLYANMTIRNCNTARTILKRL